MLGGVRLPACFWFRCIYLLCFVWDCRLRFVCFRCVAGGDKTSATRRGMFCGFISDLVLRFFCVIPLFASWFVDRFWVLFVLHCFCGFGLCLGLGGLVLALSGLPGGFLRPFLLLGFVVLCVLLLSLWGSSGVVPGVHRGGCSLLCSCIGGWLVCFGFFSFVWLALGCLLGCLFCVLFVFSVPFGFCRSLT